MSASKHRRVLDITTRPGAALAPGPGSHMPWQVHHSGWHVLLEFRVPGWQLPQR